MPLAMTWACVFCSCDFFPHFDIIESSPLSNSSLCCMLEPFPQALLDSWLSPSAGSSQTFPTPGQTRSKSPQRRAQCFCQVTRSSLARLLFYHFRDRIRPACRRYIPRKSHTIMWTIFFFPLSFCSSYCSRNDIAQEFDQALQGHPLDCLALLTHKVFGFFLNSIISLLTSQRLQQAPLLLTMTRHNFMSL